ncbi:MAG: hypothetical protein KKD44_27165 [Proteobacteria bacterium]|nr:hypothetical protein [Pseudomonadota bacterium]
MNLYCLCEKSGNKRTSLFPEPYDGVILVKQMEVFKTGAKQFIERGNKLDQHYPNVDVFHCEDCGVMIALEGGVLQREDIGTVSTAE